MRLFKYTDKNHPPYSKRVVKKFAIIPTKIVTHKRVWENRTEVTDYLWIWLQSYYVIQCKEYEEFKYFSNREMGYRWITQSKHNKKDIQNKLDSIGAYNHSVNPYGFIEIPWNLSQDSEGVLT